MVTRTQHGAVAAGATHALPQMLLRSGRNRGERDSSFNRAQTVSGCGWVAATWGTLFLLLMTLFIELDSNYWLLGKF